MELTQDHKTNATELADDMHSKATELDESNVLVMEDTPGLRSLLESTLTKLGYNVAGVPSGIDGLSVIAQFPHPEAVMSSFDMIIVDWSLPGLSGGQVLQKMRERGISTPVLILTEQSISDVLKQIERPNPCRILQKPFRIPQFLDSVRTLTGEVK